MHPASEQHIPNGLLAANVLLAENSRQGVPTSTHALHQGFGFVISHTSLEIKGSLYDGDVRSRCTGKERDTETGNDYFDARYYSSNLGRFMSPDWAAKEQPVPYATLDDPQSLNLYSYVKNNPLSRADADGHCPDACVVEGGAAVLVTAGLAVTAVVAGTAAYLHTDSGQRSFSTFTSGVSDSFSSNASAIKNTVTGWFSKSTANAPAAAIPDDANVVRGGSGAPGGANSPEGIAAGTGTHPSGVTGFSVETAPGKSVGELGKGVPNGQVGCCKAGEIRAAGGEVQATSGRSPNHGTVSGLSPEAASKLLTPTIPNPGKVKPQ